MRATLPHRAPGFADDGEPPHPSGTWLRAYQLLRKHRPLLVRGAAKYSREQPGVPLAALVVDGEPPESARMRRQLGLPNDRLSVALIQPRTAAADFLARHAPASYDWRAPEPPGRRRELPIVVITDALALFDVAHFEAA